MKFPRRVAARAMKTSPSRKNAPTSSPSADSAFKDAVIPPGLFQPHVAHLKSRPYFGAAADIRYLLVEKTAAAARADKTRTDLRPAFAKPMSTWLQVLSAPTADTPGACLLLHHDTRRYLFGNVSEGTQRIAVQRKMSMAKAEEIFLTGPINWHTVGGLLGMILTIADVTSESRTNLIKQSNKKKSETAAESKPSLRIHGAENLTHMLATARRFIFRKGLPLRPYEILTDPRAVNPENTEPDWQDSNIMVWYVPLYAEGVKRPTKKRDRDVMASNDDSSDKDHAKPSAVDKEVVDFVVKHMFDSDWQFDTLTESTLHSVGLPATLFVKDEKGHLKKYDGPLPGSADDVPDIPVLVRKPWPGTSIKDLPRTKPARQSMCYIVKNQPRRGKFNPAEAVKHGVPKPDYKKLATGESVRGTDGVLVTPDMVLGATIEGNGFAMVDIPDLSYISSFLGRPEWTNETLFNHVKTIHWVLGPGVVYDPRIQEFMQTHQSVKHTVSSPDTCPNSLALEGPASLSIRLNRIDPDRFPIPRYNNVSPYQQTQEPAPFDVSRPGATVSLAPQYRVQDDNLIPLFDPMAVLNNMDKQVTALADAARTKLTDEEFLARVEEAEQDIPHRDAEVIPLGTGSALPSKYRNVSATLLRVPGHGSYLFDAGENTLGSLRRLYGAEGADEILRDLKAIWISHLHADHHLGTAGVIRAWRDATAASADPAHREARLLVASHRNMLEWLCEYAGVEDFGYDRLRPVQVGAKHDRAATSCVPVEFDGADAKELGGLGRIDSTYVTHCHGALAVVLTWPGTGLKVAYSGDCRPSNDFAALGRGATLLIHESTFADELQGEAKAKKHCTMAEALAVGRKMRARRIVLTHFSQRYPKIPVFDADPKPKKKTVRKNQKEEEEGHPDAVALIAFDHMTVKLGDFRKAAVFLPAMQRLFEDGDEAGKEE